ncbi:MAG: hypothetical protein WAV84_16400 [Bacteroidota bacterium]
MNIQDYSQLTDEQLKEYISALADKDSAGLSTQQIDVLQHVVNERPELLGEYQLNIATKLCLLKHAKNIRCPDSTSEAIRSILYHVYKSQQSSL